MTNIIDLTFNAKRKQNFYGQTTYIVKVSFFDVSASIYSYLAFNLGKKKKLNLIVAVPKDRTQAFIAVPKDRTQAFTKG